MDKFYFSKVRDLVPFVQFKKRENLMEECNFGEVRNLVPFIQFKKPEKYPWRSVNFRKVAV